MVFRRKIVYEHEIGLRFRNGKFLDIVDPGRYSLWGSSNEIFTIDMRPKMAVVGGQDVMTQDGGTLRLSLAFRYRVSDPKSFYLAGGFEVNATPPSSWRPVQGDETSPQLKLYAKAQILLREWTAARSLAEVLDQRMSLGPEITQLLKETATQNGLDLEAVDLRDFNVAGNIRAAYADLLKAELEGQSALQRARNEAATMRSLLNTARLVREHPGLLELRVLTSGQKPRVNFVVSQPAGGTLPGAPLPEEEV